MIITVAPPFQSGILLLTNNLSSIQTSLVQYKSVPNPSAQSGSTDMDGLHHPRKGKRTSKVIEKFGIA